MSEHMKDLEVRCSSGAEARCDFSSFKVVCFKAISVSMSCVV